MEGITRRAGFLPAASSAGIETRPTCLIIGLNLNPKNQRLSASHPHRQHYPRSIFVCLNTTTPIPK